MTRELSGDFPRSLNNIHHLLELSSDFENDRLFCVDTLSTHEQFFLNYDTLCSLDTYGKALDDLFSRSAINDLRDKAVLSPCCFTIGNLTFTSLQRSFHHCFSTSEPQRSLFFVRETMIT